MRRLVGELYVSASNREVIRHIRSRLRPEAKTREWREARHAAYREALRIHHENQELVRTFRL